VDLICRLFVSYVVAFLPDHFTSHSEIAVQETGHRPIIGVFFLEGVRSERGQAIEKFLPKKSRRAESTNSTAHMGQSIHINTTSSLSRDLAPKSITV
jgi:hypothetical protein